MATNNDTWDSTDVGYFMDMAKKAKTRLMKYIFWGVLEHDTHTAAKLAKESASHADEVHEKLQEFAKAYKALRKSLLAATRNSEKF